jgi:S-adenosylmethionine uptake transporter
MQSLWMIVAALLFSVMGVAVKLASAQYETWEIVMYRGLIGVAVMGAVIAIDARRSNASVGTALATTRLGMHLTRGISGTISLTLWFFSIAGLPIATAMTINYASPLFIGAWVAWSAYRAGRSMDATMLVALAFGFAGVVLLLQPTVASDQWIFAAIGTVSAALTAVAYLSVKALGQAGEPNGRIVFYFSAMNAAAGFAGALVFGFHRHDLRGVSLLACVGVCATLAQLAMTRAYASGGTLLTANLGFTGIIFASIWGVVLFDDAIHAASAVGMGIIVTAGVTATLLTARTLRRTEASRDEAVGSH